MDTGVHTIEGAGDIADPLEDGALQEAAFDEAVFEEGFGEATFDEGRGELSFDAVRTPDTGVTAKNVATDVSAMQAVMELCDENSISRTLDVPVPKFSDCQSHLARGEFAPQPETQLRREQSLREAGDWLALAQLLIERAEQTRSALDASDLLVEAALLYRDALESSEGAQAILEKALDIEPSHEAAAFALEKLTERTGSWAALVSSLGRAAEALRESEPSVAGELLIRAACARAHGLGDIDGACSQLANVGHAIPHRADEYLNALERMIHGLGSLESLVSLSQRIGDGARAARLMSRAIAMSQSVVERAEYHHRIALIEIDRGENSAAVWHWNEALRLDPMRNDLRDALVFTLTEQGAHRDATKVLEAARAYSTSGDEKAKYARAAAAIYSEFLGERTKAIDLFAVALKSGPGHHAASMPVIDRYFEQERWNELELVLAPVLSSRCALEIETFETVTLLSKAAICAANLDLHERALGHYRAILRVEPDNLKAHIGSAEATLALRHFPEAIASAQRAIAGLGIGGDDSPALAMLAVCASAHRSLGQQGRAVELYERCAAHMHIPSMHALAELHELRGEHHKAVALQLRIATASPLRERVELLCSASDTLANKIVDLESAIDLCWQALTLAPESRATLHRLAVLYARNKEWRDAVKTVVRMAGLESGSVRRGRYLQAAGAIASQHGQEEQAVGLFGQAMDSYFADSLMSATAEVRLACFSCFEDVLAILSTLEDWRGVERNYRRMIHRLEPGDPEVGRLWSELGHVYKEKLGETTAAIDSFEVASRQQNAGLTNHRILVDLYEGAGTDALDKAIERRRILLEAEPENAEHYKALRGLFVRTRQMDRVWCVCRALVSLGAAEQREVTFYRRSLPAQMHWPVRPLESEQWSRLRDARVDPRISRIFGLIGEHVAQHVAQQCTQPSPRHPQELRGPHAEHLRQLFSAVSYAFGLPRYNCVVVGQPTEMVGLLNIRGTTANLEPTFILGELLHRGRTVPQIASGLGRMLALGRRSYYLRLALPDQGELAAAFYAGMNLACREVTAPASLAVRTEQLRNQLARTLPHAWRAKLREAAVSFVNSGGRFSVDSWCRGADATARHAALLLTGDLGFGLGTIRSELGSGTAAANVEASALRIASVSKVHMDLREELGLQIAVSLPD